MSFKDLSFKKKIEHIWEYYRLLIFGVLFVAIAGSSMVYAMFIKEKPVNYCGVGIYNTYITEEQNSTMTDQLNESLGLVFPDTVTVTDYYFDENDKVFNVDMEQKFITYLFSLEMHLVAAPKTDVEMFVQAEYLAPLTDYYTEDELKEIEDRLVYLPDPLDGNKEKPFAINLESSKLVNDLGIFDNALEPEPCIGIVPVDGFESNIKSVLDQMIKE